MDDKLKEIHKKNAIKNGLGGNVIVKRTCGRCKCEFNGNPVSKLCKKCKGIYECNHCNIIFYSNSRNRKYCDECVDKKVWLTGKIRDKAIGEKISKSKLNFYKTNKGKEIAKNIGKNNSVRMKEYYKTQKGIKQKERTSIKLSEIMCNKIKSGEFTPNITNTFTHWDACIELDNNDVRYFRSSWEACFWYSNQQLQYEYLRIPYWDELNNKRSYIADFVDKEVTYLYELKPKKYFLKQKHKMDSIINYCTLNNIMFIWINEFNIMDYVNANIFKGNNKKQLHKLYSGIKYVK